MQAQSCVQLCDWDFWPTATAAQIQRAIAKEGVTVRAEDDEHEKTPLNWASWYGTPESVRALLAAGANIEARRRHDWTPLHVAAVTLTSEKISVLLATGANTKARNDRGETPFDLANKEPLNPRH